MNKTQFRTVLRIHDRFNATRPRPRKTTETDLTDGANGHRNKDMYKENDPNLKSERFMKELDLRPETPKFTTATTDGTDKKLPDYNESWRAQLVAVGRTDKEILKNFKECPAFSFSIYGNLSYLHDSKKPKDNSFTNSSAYREFNDLRRSLFRRLYEIASEHNGAFITDGLHDGIGSKYYLL